MGLNRMCFEDINLFNLLQYTAEKVSYLQHTNEKFRNGSDHAFWIDRFLHVVLNLAFQKYEISSAAVSLSIAST